MPHHQDFISREQARALPCPRCGARPGQNCVGSRGQLRTANHQERAAAARRSTAGALRQERPVEDHGIPVPGDWFEDTITVVKPLAFSESTTWAVLAATDSNGELIELSGSRLKRHAQPGSQLRVVGRWRHHPQYGPQIAVSRIEL
jgi:hypothetical protein